MTVQEREERSRIRRKRQVAKQKIALLLASVLVITIGSIIFGSIFSSAKDQKDNLVQYKYYKSVMIEQGDSLWSIAEEYCTDQYKNTQEYVNELKQLNALTSETIHAGEYLLVAYYDTEIH